MSKELESALAKLRILRDTADPHLFARFNSEEAAALLAKIEAAEWRPIESAPRDGTHVLAFFPDWQCTGEPRVMAVKWTGPQDSKHSWWSIPGYGGLSPELWRPIGPLPGGDDAKP